LAVGGRYWSSLARPAVRNIIGTSDKRRWERALTAVVLANAIAGTGVARLRAPHISLVVLANAGTHRYAANGRGFFRARTMIFSSSLRWTCSGMRSGMGPRLHGAFAGTTARDFPESPASERDIGSSSPPPPATNTKGQESLPFLLQRLALPSGASSSRR
jgi:hypothetical protein